MSGTPREIHLRVPRDVLRKLLDDQTKGVPFQLNGTADEGPVRIVLWGAPAQRPRGFRAKAQKLDPNEVEEG